MKKSLLLAALMSTAIAAFAQTPPAPVPPQGPAASPEGADKPRHDMHGRRDPQKMAERHITSLDTNKDGKVSRQEFLARQSQAFSKADANSDGFVTAEEMAAQYEKHRAEMAAHHEGRKGARPGRGPDAERAAPAPAK